MAEQSSSFGSALQIKNRLEPIVLTLSLLSQRDQRMGMKSLYRDQDFMAAVDHYYEVSLLLMNGLVVDADLPLLRSVVSEFIEHTKNLFPNDHSRMLTTLRGAFGKSFSVLYKNSVVLLRVLDYLEIPVDDQVIGTMSLPEQQSAPIYTKVENDRVTLEAGRSLHPFLRSDAVEKTRQYLKREFLQIEKALAASNVDQRYVEAFSRLSELVEFTDDAAAISFGLHVRTMSMITKKVEEELSDVLSVQIAATLTHAAFFASQYKDWIEFLDNAQAFNSREDVELEIDPALSQIVELLESSPKAIDGRIPHTIKLITTLLDGNADDRKQAIYAGVRSIENFCISTISYCYEQAKSLLQDAGKTARPKLVHIGAYTIITVALGVIGHFMPVIVNTSELSWILENFQNIKKLSSILKP